MSEPEGREIEWPKGSGRRAWYTPEALGLAKAFVRQRDEGAITTDEMVAQLDFFHDLYVEVGAELLPTVGVEQPSETYRIPEGALAQLRIDESIAAAALRAAPTTGNEEIPSEPEPAAPLADPGVDTIGKFHGDPQVTEIAAALRALPRTGSQRRLVLDGVGAAGERGLTDEEIAVVEGVADTAHRTRRNELVKGGWVRDSGRTRKTDSGSDSIVWVLTDQGRDRWPTLARRAG